METGFWDLCSHFWQNRIISSWSLIFAPPCIFCFIHGSVFTLNQRETGLGFKTNPILLASGQNLQESAISSCSKKDLFTIPLSALALVVKQVYIIQVSVDNFYRFVALLYFYSGLLFQSSFAHYVQGVSKRCPILVCFFFYTDIFLRHHTGFFIRQKLSNPLSGMKFIKSMQIINQS